MGAAASIQEFQNLSIENKEEIQKKYDLLLKDGKTEEEAIIILNKKVDSIETNVIETIPKVKTETNIQTILLTQLVETIKNAVDNGKTPLIIDPSEDGKVDTFFSYSGGMILDGKKMGIDKSMRKIPVQVLMDEARKKLVSSLKFGVPLIIAMTQSVTDFATTFTDEACKNNNITELDFQDNKRKFFPSEVFNNAGKNLLSEENLNFLFREEDKADMQGFTMCRNPDGFYVCLTTKFQVENFEEYLFSNEWGLPKPIEMYQFIYIKPNEE